MSKPTTRRLGAVVSATSCLIALAACGSSSKPGASASKVDVALKFAQCMRSHGVSNFPDPSTGGGRVQIGGPGSGINPQSPAFQTAQRACSKLLPNGGPGALHMSESQRQAAVRFAQCMRVNGEPDFPDPVQTPPRGVVRVLMLRGMVFALGPGVDPGSPSFREAATRCGVRPPSGPGPNAAL